MTDNFEDIEHQETVHAEEGQPTGARSNLAEAWRTRPIFKLLVVMTVAGAAIALATTFLGGSTKQEISRLPTPPESHVAPGGAASPYFIQQTKEAEEARAKEALAKGGSMMPTPIGQGADISVTEKADPMNELRSETERLKQQLAEMQRVEAQRQTQQAAQTETAQRVAQQAAQQSASTPARQQAETFDPALSQVMQAQMKQLLESWTPKGIRQVDVSKEDTVAANGAGGAAAPGYTTTNGLGQIQKGPPVVPAGTVSYAQLLTEANSDVPGPILAQIVSGPLAGSRAVGAFQVSQNHKYLVLRFTLADLKGKDYSINTLALDPDTTLGGMATEVDDRYFVRVVLPAAAAFLEGFGQELGQATATASQTATTTLVTQTSPGIKQGLAEGASQAAQTAASFFQSEANNTHALVRVAAGTPMGLFFVSSVYDQTASQAATPSGIYSNGCPPGTAPGYSIGGRVVNLPTGQTNGCYATGPGGSFTGATTSAGAPTATPTATPGQVGTPVGGPYGNPFGNTNPYASSTVGGDSGSVPYPNYGAGSSNPYRNYGSPFSYGNTGGGVGAPGTLGSFGYGH